MNNVVWTGSVSELINVPCLAVPTVLARDDRERERAREGKYAYE